MAVLLATRGKRLRTWLGGLGCALSLGAAITLCLKAPAPPARELPAARRRAVGESLVSREAGMRRTAEKQFPGDLWSQDDAFHNQEQALVRSAARRERVAIGSVLSALDEALRSHPRGAHKYTATPCKPRPFYD
jgi:hypothetical protein